MPAQTNQILLSWLFGFCVIWWEDWVLWLPDSLRLLVSVSILVCLLFERKTNKNNRSKIDWKWTQVHFNMDKVCGCGLTAWDARRSVTSTANSSSVCRKMRDDAWTRTSVEKGQNRVEMNWLCPKEWETECFKEDSREENQTLHWCACTNLWDRIPHV